MGMDFGILELGFGIFKLVGPALASSLVAPYKFLKGRTMRLFAGTQFDIPPKCERCGLLETECTCPPQKASLVPPDQQIARLQVEKRKKGKVVTVIRGLAAEANDLPELLGRLKDACGAGGTIKEGTLEIQGEHVDRLRAVLSQIGYRVK